MEHARIKHDSLGHTSTIPAFLLKLRGLLDDPETDDLIQWDQSGQSFHLMNQNKFSKDVLPQFFKHNNLASFVRQLNMYGFKKVSSLDQGGLHTSRDEMEFVNPYFVRDEPELMEHIKRKGSVMKDKVSEITALKPAQVRDVLFDVKDLKETQNNITDQLDMIKRENGVLWREIATLRQKHVQQQQIINKLIQFLMTMAGGARKRNLKRSMARMIEGAPPTKLSTPDSNVDLLASATAASGLKIQDITDEHSQEEEETTTASAQPVMQLDDDPLSIPVTVDPTLPLDKQLDYAFSLSDAQQNGTVVVAAPDILKTELYDNITDLQYDLDSLKDLFSSDYIGLAPESVTQLFDGATDRIPPVPSRLQFQLSPMLNLEDLIDTSSPEDNLFLTDGSSQDPANDFIGSGMLLPADDAELTPEKSLEELVEESTGVVSHGQTSIVSTHELD